MMIKNNGEVMNIEDHINWAGVVASKFRLERNIPMEHEEAVSLGMVGLMKAARNYEEGEGRFRSLAWLKIRGEIKDRVKLDMGGKRNAEVVSLDNIPNWMLPSVNGTVKRLIDKDLVECILDSVSFDQAYALERYYLDGIRMREIAEEMGFNESRVSQIIAAGRKRAREIWTEQI